MSYNETQNNKIIVIEVIVIIRSSSFVVVSHILDALMNTLLKEKKDIKQKEMVV